MPQQRLTDGEVLAGVKEMVGKGKVKWTPHSRERMEQRKYDSDQIKECLRTGYFTERPSIPNRPGPIEYKFTMRASIDGDFIEVAAALLPETQVLVITVIDPDKS